jgi:hypothetical protein
MSAADQEKEWTCHGWDDHVRGQLEHAHALTFRQRLEWLEEMSALVEKLATSPQWPGHRNLHDFKTWQVNEAASPSPRPPA